MKKFLRCLSGAIAMAFVLQIVPITGIVTPPKVEATVSTTLITDPSKPNNSPELEIVGRKVMIKGTDTEVMLRGVNIGSGVHSPTALSAENVDGNKGAPGLLKYALNELDANVIRLGIQANYWFGKDEWSQKHNPSGANYRNKINELIDEVSKAGKWVIFNLHQFNAIYEWQNGKEMYYVDFWREVAADPKYANNPTLLFGLLNEPTGDWNRWEKGVEIGNPGDPDYTKAIGHQELVEIVRDAGANNILIAGGIAYAGSLTRIAAGGTGDSYDLDLIDRKSDQTHITATYAAGAERAGNGIMYDMHKYPIHGTESNWTHNAGTARSRYPVIMGEYGWQAGLLGHNPAPGASTFHTNWFPAIYKWMNDDDGTFGQPLHHTAFTLHNTSGPPMLVNKSDWNTNIELNAVFGKYVNEELQRLITNSTLSRNLVPTASDTDDNAGNSPRNVTDGRRDTQWVSTNTPGDKWIEIDLRTNADINRWYVRNVSAEDPATASQVTSDYRLEYWKWNDNEDPDNYLDPETETQRNPDKGAWTVPDWGGVVTGNTVTLTDKIVDIEHARYVRLVITKPDQGSGNVARIVQFAVMGYMEPPETVPIQMPTSLSNAKRLTQVRQFNPNSANGNENYFGGLWYSGEEYGNEIPSVVPDEGGNVLRLRGSNYQYGIDGAGRLFGDMTNVDYFQFRMKTTANMTFRIDARFGGATDGNGVNFPEHTLQGNTVTLPSTNGEWKDVLVPIEDFRPAIPDDPDELAELQRQGKDPRFWRETSGDASPKTAFKGIAANKLNAIRRWLPEDYVPEATQFPNAFWPVMIARISSSQAGYIASIKALKEETTNVNFMPNAQDSSVAEVNFITDGINTNDGLREGTTLIEARLRNSGTRTLNNVIFMANMYNKDTGRIVATDSNVISIANGTNTPVQSFRLTMPDGDSPEDYAIKLFAISGNDSPYPLTPSLIMESTGIRYETSEPAAVQAQPVVNMDDDEYGRGATLRPSVTGMSEGEMTAIVMYRNVAFPTFPNDYIYVDQIKATKKTAPVDPDDEDPPVVDPDDEDPPVVDPDDEDPPVVDPPAEDYVSADFAFRVKTSAIPGPYVIATNTASGVHPPFGNTVTDRPTSPPDNSMAKIKVLEEYVDEYYTFDVNVPNNRVNFGTLEQSGQMTIPKEPTDDDPTTEEIIDTGYSEEDIRNITRTVTVKNTGSADSGTLQIVKSGNNPDAFVINKSKLVVKKSTPGTNDGDDTFTIAPIPGISRPNIYSMTITISGGENPIVSFDVTMGITGSVALQVRDVAKGGQPWNGGGFSFTSNASDDDNDPNSHEGSYWFMVQQSSSANYPSYYVNLPDEDYTGLYKVSLWMRAVTHANSPAPFADANIYRGISLRTSGGGTNLASLNRGNQSNLSSEWKYYEFDVSDSTRQNFANLRTINIASDASGTPFGAIYISGLTFHTTRHETAVALTKGSAPLLNHDFDPLETGSNPYGPQEGQALEVGITNTGVNDAGELDIEVVRTSGSDNAFVLSDNKVSVSMITPGTFRIWPNVGLTAGTHEATVNVKKDGAVLASFTVRVSVIRFVPTVVTIDNETGNRISTFSGWNNGIYYDGNGTGKELGMPKIHPTAGLKMPTAMLDGTTLYFDDVPGDPLKDEGGAAIEISLGIEGGNHSTRAVTALPNRSYADLADASGQVHVSFLYKNFNEVDVPDGDGGTTKELLASTGPTLGIATTNTSATGSVTWVAGNVKIPDLAAGDGDWKQIKYTASLNPNYTVNDINAIGITTGATAIGRILLSDIIISSVPIPDIDLRVANGADRQPELILNNETPEEPFGEIAFSAVNKGYIVLPQSGFSVLNVGSAASAGVPVTLTGDNADAFTLNMDTLELPINSTANLTVTAKPDLAPGDYSAKIVIGGREDLPEVLSDDDEEDDTDEDPDTEDPDIEKGELIGNLAEENWREINVTLTVNEFGGEIREIKNVATNLGSTFNNNNQTPPLIITGGVNVTNVAAGGYQDGASIRLAGQSANYPGRIIGLPEGDYSGLKKISYWAKAEGAMIGAFHDITLWDSTLSTGGSQISSLSRGNRPHMSSEWQYYEWNVNDTSRQNFENLRAFRVIFGETAKSSATDIFYISRLTFELENEDKSVAMLISDNEITNSTASSYQFAGEETSYPTKEGEAITVNVRSTGISAPGELDIRITPSDDESINAFVVSKTGLDIGLDGYDSFTVYPADGLGAGIYRSTIEIVLADPDGEDIVLTDLVVRFVVIEFVPKNVHIDNGEVSNRLPNVGSGPAHYVGQAPSVFNANMSLGSGVTTAFDEIDVDGRTALFVDITNDGNASLITYNNIGGHDGRMVIPLPAQHDYSNLSDKDGNVYTSFLVKNIGTTDVKGMTFGLSATPTSTSIPWVVSNSGIGEIPHSNGGPNDWVQINLVGSLRGEYTSADITSLGVTTKGGSGEGRLLVSDIIISNAPIGNIGNLGDTAPYAVVGGLTDDVLVVPDEDVDYEVLPSASFTVADHEISAERGNLLTGPLTVELDGTTSEKNKFTLSKGTIDPDGVDTVEVTPVSALGIGTYTVRIKLSGGGLAADKLFNVSFTVGGVVQKYVHIDNYAETNRIAEVSSGQLHYPGQEPSHLTTAFSENTGADIDFVGITNRTLHYTDTENSGHAVLLDYNNSGTDEGYTLAALPDSHIYSGLADKNGTVYMSLLVKNIGTTDISDVKFGLARTPIVGETAIVWAINSSSIGNIPHGDGGPCDWVQINLSGTLQGTLTTADITQLGIVTPAGSEGKLLISDVIISNIPIADIANLAEDNNPYAAVSGLVDNVLTIPDEDIDYEVAPSVSFTVSDHAVSADRGNTLTGPLTVTLSGTDEEKANFTISGDEIDVDGTDSISISPILGLELGTYTVDVILSGGNLAADKVFTVSFTVNDGFGTPILTISSVELNGDEVNAFAKDVSIDSTTNEVEVAISNAGGKAHATMYIACYKGDKLVSFEASDSKVLAKTGDTVLTASAPTNGADSLKVFIWETDTMLPLFEAPIITGRSE